MLTERNQFFNPAHYDTEVFGFFEELIALDPSSSFGFRTLGTRQLSGLPSRAIGAPGRILIELTEPTMLQKGHKTSLVKASKAKPVKCYSMIQPICGPRKS
jgi:hypothetical protein